MENERPKTIKTVGTVIMALSAFIIFSNGMSALMSTLMQTGEGASSEQEHQTPISIIISHNLELCLFLVTIGAFYLLGGLFIQKYKLWANRFVSFISGLQVLIVWAIMLIIRSSFGQEPGLEILNTWTIIVAIIWTVPFGLLIWFLNKKEIIKYFE